jgi:Tfp pilus assembly protein PilE
MRQGERKGIMRRLRLLGGTGGQGLIEVVGVVGTFAVLLAIGVPSYFGFRDGQAEQQAKDSLLAAVPAAETYRVKRGSYAGLDTVKLTRIDPRISRTLVVGSARRGRYCLMETAHGQVWSVAGRIGGKPRFRSDGCSRA